MRYLSLAFSKNGTSSASVTVTWLLKASAVTGTTSSLIFSLRFLNSATTSASLTDIHPVSAVRNFSIIRARRRLFSNSVVESGGFWTWRICR